MFNQYGFALLCIVFFNTCIYANEDSLVQLKVELALKDQELEQLTHTINSLHDKNIELQKDNIAIHGKNEELKIANGRYENNPFKKNPGLTFFAGALTVSLIHTTFNIPIDLSDVGSVLR